MTQQRFSRASYQFICMGLGALFSLSAAAEQGNPRVNQLGYLPNSVKIATYKTSAGPQQWQLKQNGNFIALGQTTTSKADAASGDNLQQIDLSDVVATGDNFVLTVGSDSSYPFSIKADVYKGALYDSLRYFYHNRAGISIETQFTGGGNGSYAANAKWSRPAGHINQGANKGDLNVPCWSTRPCNYTLDVPKGWYDAGDHGKYVVNGGISAWTLLHMYEHFSRYWPSSEALSDGKLNIPESSNGMPDILDEARWEVEFLLAMQVPVGQPKAGMAHHKLHDEGWTGIPTRPDMDSNRRSLVYPTTAATLNLAAVAAQAARAWRGIDNGFADKCLVAAKRAWDAAAANPNDIYNDEFNSGGGGYGDSNLGDEFYWAAVELYLATADSKYVATINQRNVTRTDLNWQETDLAGLMSLATVTTNFTETLQHSARQKIIAAANAHIDTQNGSGYSTPLTTYPWGSNSAVTNNLYVMGMAYDFTHEVKFAQGLIKGLDYIHGRNVFSTSFVTGEGTNTCKQPHHRFWANAANASFPTPPPGAICGGPNTGLEDDLAKMQKAGCESKPATCWIDNIGAWSVNEITINWNAPYAWVLNWANNYANNTTGPSSSSSATSRSSSSKSMLSSSQAVVSSVAAFSQRIEAENYAHMSGIDTQATSDLGGGLNVGWTDAGDWITYPVNLPAAGQYKVSYRIASQSGGGILRLEKAGGGATYGQLSVRSTGNWQAWETIDHQVPLPAGQQTIAIYVVAGGFNLNWIQIESVGVAPSSSSQATSQSSSIVPSSRSSSSSSPLPSSSSSKTSASSSSVPVMTLVKIEAESFAQMSGFQTQATSDEGGGLNVGWTDAGDWLSYSNTVVTIPTTGLYTLELRVASESSGGSLVFEEAGGAQSYGTINFTATGGWQQWKTVTATVNLSAGTHRFGIKALSGGWNLNWFSLSQVSGGTSSSSNSSSSSSVNTDPNHYNAPRVASAPVIDGSVDSSWSAASWAPIDVFWLGSQQPTAADFSGRYKAMWDANYLYLLFDITDDVLLDASSNPLERYWDDDSVEIFIDENKNGGNHQYNTSAWAYHIGTLGDTVDFTNSTSPKLLNDHITVKRVTVGTKHMWEMRVRIYGENYVDGGANTPLTLTVGKQLGFSAAYNDNDASAQRESMMGSVNTQGHKNDQGYINASVFGSMTLTN